MIGEKLSAEDDDFSQLHRLHSELEAEEMMESANISRGGDLAACSSGSVFANAALEASLRRSSQAAANGSAVSVVEEEEEEGSANPAGLEVRVEK